MTANASTLQQFSLFGRKYELTVSLPAANGQGAELLTLASSAFEPEALRVTFDVYTPAFQAYWYADICVYNLDQGLTQKILNAAAPPQNTAQTDQPITQGVIVTLSAGYQQGAYGVIWKGVLFQPLWERENAVDFKLTLHCLTALDKYSRNFISGQYAAGMNQTQLLNNIMQQTTSGPAPIQAASGASVSKNLGAGQTFSRGVALFGNPKKYMDQTARSNNMQWWESNGGLNLGSPDEDIGVSSADPLVFTPPPLPGVNSSAPVIPSKNQGIIVGTPQQTQLGVSFRALLNPHVLVQKPLPKVKLDYTQLRLQKKQIGQLPGLLDQDGVYVVGGARFTGDNRGQEWYVDITGYTVVGNALGLFLGYAATAAKPGLNQ